MPALSLIAAAATSVTPAVSGRSASNSAVPPSTSSIISRSLCAPATVHTSTIGLSPNTATARAAELPRRCAIQPTSAVQPRLASPATALNAHSACATVSCPSGRAPSVKSGP